MENMDGGVLQIPTIDLRQIFLTMANILSIFGLILNIFLVYLLFFKTPKNMAQYKIILIQNCFVDMLYNVVNEICKGQTDYKYGAFYVIGSDLLKSMPLPYNFIFLIFWIFTLFYCVSTIPVQFIYRYHIIVREKTLSKCQYFFMLSIAMLGAASVAIYTGFVLYPKENLLKEKSLLLKNDIYYFREIPFFLVAEIQKWPLRLSFAFAYLLVLTSYGITIFSSYKVWKSLKSHMLIFSFQTRRMHNQMTKTMILQATVPLIFLLIPIGSAILAVFSQINVPGLGMLLNGFCCWIPVANPLVTITSIKAYRMIIIRWIRICLRKCKKNMNAVASSFDTSLPS